MTGNSVMMEILRGTEMNGFQLNNKRYHQQHLWLRPNLWQQHQWQQQLQWSSPLTPTWEWPPHQLQRVMVAASGGSSDGGLDFTRGFSTLKYGLAAVLSSILTLILILIVNGIIFMVALDSGEGIMLHDRYTIGDHVQYSRVHTSTHFSHGHGYR